MVEQTLDGKIIDMLQQRLDKEYWRANVAEQKLEELSDVQSLKDSYEQRLADRDKVIEEKDKAIERKDAEIARLKALLEYAKRKLWGSMSEKRRVPDDPNQLTLDFGDTELTEAEKADLAQAEKEVEKQRKKITVKEHVKMKPVRQKLPESLPRVKKHIYPEGYFGHEDEWIEIGTEETEHLEIIPAKVQVLVKVYHTYKRKDTGEIVSPKAETEPVAKSYATASLLTEIIANKYAFHLPFYRQIEMIKSQCGFAIPQSTIEGWFAEVANLMRPLYYRMREYILSQDYVQADESTIPIINNEKKRTVKGYFWLVRSVMNRMVFLHYDHGSRASAVAKDIFDGYRGAIQVDGYEGYSFLKKQDGVILICCWVHLRRYFDRAISNDRARAEFGLEQISKLYTIEHMADEQGFNYMQRCELRKRLAHPIVVAFEKWCLAEYPKVLPKSPIGKALHYMIEYARELSHYLIDGRYLLDNNLIENCVRPLAVGRKGYLFCGNDSAAEDAAVIYSMMGTCKSCGVDFRAWLNYFLNHVHDYDTDYSLDLIGLLPPHLLEKGILKPVSERI